MSPRCESIAICTGIGKRKGSTQYQRTDRLEPGLVARALFFRGYLDIPQEPDLSEHWFGQFDAGQKRFVFRPFMAVIPWWFQKHCYIGTIERTDLGTGYLVPGTVFKGGSKWQSERWFI